MKIPIDPKLATQTLSQIVPAWDEFIGELVNDPEPAAKISKFAEASGLAGYAILYLDSQNLLKLILLSLMPVEQINNLNDYCSTLSTEQAIEFANRTVANLNDSPEKLDEIFDSHLPDDSVDADLSQLPLRTKFLLTSFLVWFHDIVSFLVHGQRITDLVQRAVKGDDDALCLAAQTDKRVMSIPYFRERMLKALNIETKADAQFIYNLSYRLQNPLLRGKIYHRNVWIALLLLDTMALLDGQLTHTEILDMLEAAGIEGVGSEDNLSKMLRKYRAYQSKT